MVTLKKKNYGREHCTLAQFGTLANVVQISNVQCLHAVDQISRRHPQKKSTTITKYSHRRVCMWQIMSQKVFNSIEYASKYMYLCVCISKKKSNTHSAQLKFTGLNMTRCCCCRFCSLSALIVGCCIPGSTVY